jgi:hypothetical protein
MRLPWKIFSLLTFLISQEAISTNSMKKDKLEFALFLGKTGEKTELRIPLNV